MLYKYECEWEERNTNKIYNIYRLRTHIYLRVIQNYKDIHMISKILVAVDSSRHAENAFKYASYMAKKCGCGLLIAHVLEEFVGVGHSILKELEQNDLELLQKYKSRAKESAASISVDVIESRGNDVAEEILRLADEQKADTIVVGSRGLKASKEFLMGSTSYKITHYAKCPVIIVR
jgi:nucleotide-binding universal stress UspA family protein